MHAYTTIRKAMVNSGAFAAASQINCDPPTLSTPFPDRSIDVGARTVAAVNDGLRFVFVRVCQVAW